MSHLIICPRGCAMNDNLSSSLYSFLVQRIRKAIWIYMQPLIEELVQLWNDGIMTYDVSLRQNFSMKVVLLWTVSDFPTYGMLFGWMTAGKLSTLFMGTNNRGWTVIINFCQWIINSGVIRRLFPKTGRNYLNLLPS